MKELKEGRKRRQGREEKRQFRECFIVKEEQKNERVKAKKKGI